MKVYEAKIYQNPLNTEPYRFLAENWDEANKKLADFLESAKKDTEKTTLLTLHHWITLKR